MEIVEFKIAEIKDTVARITSESPGPSGVCPLILKKRTNTLAGYLQLLFTKIIEEKTIPKINLTSIIIPLLKLDKKLRTPAKRIHIDQ